MQQGTTLSARTDLRLYDTNDAKTLKKNPFNVSLHNSAARPKIWGAFFDQVSKDYESVFTC